ncbi:hypothetical protein TRFO_37525 [Tritrichomonas foetus]|uniref:DUF3447 domain-containing protein n=1 Tax=Tritrichomonas foetus TaxID=1144522 RepID=A0A1J4JFR4_9EUKA|nr:hypothetical protein TRFO_37525 [Tritrichomonas foetus]|eukprot:OHS96309.1 hypothetical protein TRFO_37525 [Tritrichomonas foetus]
MQIHVNNIGYLQDFLLNSDDINIHRAKTNILSFIKDSTDQNELINSFAKNLIAASKMQPQNIPKIADVVNQIFSQDEELKFHHSKKILKILFTSIKSNFNLAEQCTTICLMHHFMRNGLFDFKDIPKLFQSENVGVNKNKKAIFSIFFCWFAPMIEEQDVQLFNELNENVFHFHEEISFGYAFKVFYDNIDKLKENNWNLHQEYIKAEQNVGTLSEAIKYDNDDFLRKMAANPSFDVNMSLESSVFEPCWIIQNRPTLIQFAAFFGAIKCFKFLLASGANLNVMDQQNRQLQTFAIAGGNIEIVRLCQQNRVDFSNFVQTAAEFYQHDIFHWLISTVQISNNDKINIFCLAAASNNLYILNYCFEEFIKNENSENEKIDINSKNEIGMNAFLLAAENGSYEALLILLERNEIDVCVTDTNNKNALHFACEHNHYQITEALLKLRKLDINAPGFRKMTALCLASYNGCFECVQLLLNYEFISDENVNKIERDHDNSLKKRRKLFLNNHADYSLATPLHLACWQGHLNIVELLLKEELVDVTTLMDDIRTPLHIAAENGKSDIVKILIEHEPILVNLQDSKGNTALHLAVFNEEINTIRVLLESGLCDKSITEKIFLICNLELHLFHNGVIFNIHLTALKYAQLFNSMEIIALFNLYP